MTRQKSEGTFSRLMASTSQAQEKTSEKPSSLTPPSETKLDQQIFPPSPPKRSSKTKVTTETQERGKEGSRETGKETPQPGRREVDQSYDLNEKPYRKDSFLFTNKEFEALEDLKLDLRRKFDLPATKNDIARCALRSMMEDYQQHQEKSIVVRLLKSRRTR